jgi:hypothetical protein
MLRHEFGMVCLVHIGWRGSLMNGGTRLLGSRDIMSLSCIIRICLALAHRMMGGIGIPCRIMVMTISGIHIAAMPVTMDRTHLVVQIGLVRSGQVAQGVMAAGDNTLVPIITAMLGILTSHVQHANAVVIPHLTVICLRWCYSWINMSRGQCRTQIETKLKPHGFNGGRIN